MVFLRSKPVRNAVASGWCAMGEWPVSLACDRNPFGMPSRGVRPAARLRHAGSCDRNPFGMPSRDRRSGLPGRGAEPAIETRSECRREVSASRLPGTAPYLRSKPVRNAVARMTAGFMTFVEFACDRNPFGMPSRVHQRSVRLARILSCDRNPFGMPSRAGGSGRGGQVLRLRSKPVRNAVARRVGSSSGTSTTSLRSKPVRNAVARASCETGPASQRSCDRNPFGMPSRGPGRGVRAQQP